MISGHFNRKKN